MKAFRCLKPTTFAAALMTAFAAHASPAAAPGRSGLDLHVPAPSTSIATGQTESAYPTGSALRLSLHDAIDMAMRNNLQTLLAHEQRKQESARRGEALAALLPNLSGAVSQTRRTTNLRAEGIELPGQPPVVGPYDTFGARAQLVQRVFDLSALRSYQAAKVQVEIARLQENLARQQVASGTELDYVEAVRSRDAIKAAQANLKQARRLLKLAEDQHTAGVATGVDVVRAQTSVAQRRTALIQAQTQADTADLRLKRAIGAPLGREIILTENLPSTALPPPSLRQALTTALSNRDELKIDKRTMAAADYQRSAARDSLLPTIDVSGGYGLSGITPRRSDELTYSYGVEMRIPIFSGGSNRAKVDLAESRRREAQLRLHDLHQQVSEDVRLALKRLASARQRLAAARDTEKLATRELQLARDRFANGAADNIEVVDAQTSLANARNEVVSALAAYNTERVNLAAALGKAQSFHF